ncbi:AAA-like domain-containing protein [cf. Phormidesmis sp. LEGE 11477]|uniref:AAA-like domain-containing protein n=1 Tax=cf. Phormidesmis sp. LEGE 11477 TaxID=1828680 RepID=UPI00187F9B68|nr:AAA-like domain-containing protein [cf. Phormidesmis sp. LEGE 11477]MBE9062992.1 AAA-like domain-containing protein [cf. Phormidesmis sp. LEGE 11477]
MNKARGMMAPENLGKRKILFFAANPRDTEYLNLPAEVEEIRDGLGRAKYRDSFTFEERWATPPREMQNALLEVDPQIVHFSGHGSSVGELILEGEGGLQQPVPSKELYGLFGLFPSIKCVVLNACFSKVQAEAIAAHVPYTVGMNAPIGDRAAIEFAAGFYRALGTKEKLDFEFAFHFACRAISFQGIPEGQTPVCILKGGRRLPTYQSTSGAAASQKGSNSTREISLVYKPTKDVPHEAVSPPSVSAEILRLGSQDGAVDLDSPFYVRSPLEERACEAVNRPGALLRIKSSHGMGKSSLAIRVLDYAKAQGHRTVTIDFKATNEKFFQDLDQFAKWFCASVGKPLGIRKRTEDYWDDMFGPNGNCEDYFQDYLLTGEPLTLALENFDRLFDYPQIETDFCALLRGWHEKAKRDDRWDLLRLVIVYSQESYEPKDINQSPFNVGFPIELGPWTQAEVEALSAQYRLTFDQQDLSNLMDLTGGHPHLVHLILPSIALGESSLSEIMAIAATEAGIYSSHLRERLIYLEKHPELKEAMQSVVEADELVRIKSQDAHRLVSMGLIKRVSNDVEPLCRVYQEYFREQLAV